MSWCAKPSGVYGYTSTEGRANIYEINTFFNNRGYTLESQAGIIGNVFGESGLNPWRWQSDKYNRSGGYGLFQFTPAKNYIDGYSHIEHYAPNLSTSSITSGASPTDGIAQLTVFDSGAWGWKSSCWRTYWDKDSYPSLYAVRNEILNIYGNGSSLTMSQFKDIDNVYYATFAFLACFEGPAVPNLSKRYEYAIDIYTMLTGDTPIDPHPPTRKKKMPLWLYLRYF